MITSEAGKTLIQTCLNSPDPPSTSTSTADQRMSATGYEETELTYNVPEDISAAEQQQKESDEEEDEDEIAGVDSDDEEVDTTGPRHVAGTKGYVNKGDPDDDDLGQDIDEEEEEVETPRAALRDDQPIPLVVKRSGSKSVRFQVQKNSKSRIAPKPSGSSTAQLIMAPSSSSSSLTPCHAIPTQANVISLPGTVVAAAAPAAGAVTAGSTTAGAVVTVAASQASTPVRVPQIQPAPATGGLIILNSQGVPIGQSVVQAAAGFPAHTQPSMSFKPIAVTSQQLPLMSSTVSVQPTATATQVAQSLGHFVRPDGTLVRIQPPPPNNTIGPPLTLMVTPTLTSSAVATQQPPPAGLTITPLPNKPEPP